MKNILLIALLFTSAVYSQGGDRIKAFKTAHITNALDLTSAEAEKFWPVYNAHERKMTALRQKERREIFQVVKGDMDGLTEKEANDLIEKGIQFKTTELQYFKDLVENLRGIIPSKKILKLRKAEQEFKRILLERMRNRQ
ncbi:MAG: hypothetical protein DRI70_08260, partial [Bacteroidetes bacterium]